MAAEIAIRTTKAVFIGGDTVYGAVYLRVSSPTSAYGIWIKFCGSETQLRRDEIREMESIIELYEKDISTTCTKYLPSDNVVLFEFDEPIALGQYVFPFCKQLPRDLPERYDAPRLRFDLMGRHSSTDIKWNSHEAKVVYFIEASLIGAGNLSISQLLVIKQPSLSLARENDQLEGDFSPRDLIPQESKVCHVRTFLPIWKTQMEILSSLDKAEYVSGENLKLKLNMNVMGTVKPSVSYVAVQLLQELRLNSKNQREPCGVDADCDIRKIPETSSYENLQSGVSSSERDLAVVIWDSGRLFDKDGTLFHRGFDELLIPLKDRLGSPLAATTKSHSFTLSYSVKVEILLQRNEPIVLKLPLYGISQRPKEWQQWRPSDWLFECQLMSSYKSPSSKSPSSYQVSEEILHSTEFAPLPSFQVDC